MGHVTERRMAVVPLPDRSVVETERLLRLLFDANPIAIGISTMEGQWLRVNDSFLLMTDLDPEDVPRMSVRELAEDAGAIARHLRVVRRGSSVRDREIVLRRPDGSTLVALVSIEPIHLSEGPLALWLLLDITARKAAEARLHESERRVQEANRLLEVLMRAQSAYIGAGGSRAVFEGLLADVVAMTGSGFGVLAEAETTEDGAAFLRTVAMTNTANDADGVALYDRHREVGLEIHDLDGLYGRALTTGTPVRDIGDGGSGALPVPAATSFLGLPLRGPGGDVVGVLAIANRAQGYDDAHVAMLVPLLAVCGTLFVARRTLRLQRAAEQALRDSEERFRLLVDGARDYALIMLDPFGRVSSWNPGATQITGWAADEIVDVHLSRFYPAEAVAAREPERDLRTAEVEGRCEVEGWRIRRDGTQYWASVVLTPLRDVAGVARGFAMLARDVTARRELERMKDEFVSIVSHELRTPLTAIRGAMSLLRGGVMGELPPMADEMIEIAAANCDRLVRLVNDILDISKIESGKMELRLAALPPAGTVSRALDGLAAWAGEAQVTLAQDVGCAQPWRGDADRVIQVLTNLLSNGIKYSPSGGIVTVRVAACGEARSRITVADQGPGIPADKLGLLFGKFQQVDASDSRQRGGTGLGLAISKAIVELHGGAIGVDSEVGVGTTFWFELDHWQEES